MSRLGNAKKLAGKLIMPSLLSLLLPFSLPSHGAEQSVSSERDKPRWFEIEIILYKSTSEDGLINESWATDTKLELPEELVDFLQPFALPSSPETPYSEILRSDNNENPNSLEYGNNVKDANKTNLPTVVNFEEFTQESQATKAVQIEQELPFIALDHSLLQLKNESQNISAHPSYELLAHFSWRQPVIDKKNAVPVRIAGGTDYHENFEYSGEKKLDIMIEEDHQEAIDNQPPDSSLFDITGSIIDNVSSKQSQSSNLQPIALPWVPEIDGSLVVYIQRNYLHVDTNLFYRRPDKEEIDIFGLGPQLPPLEGSQDFNGIPINLEENELEASGFTWQYDDDFLIEETEIAYTERLFNYPLKQKRRLRSTELHYFDHPLIGMLVMIRPYDIEVEETQTKPNGLE